MAVLFVHGVPATSRLWREVIRLVDRDDEVLAVDLPGMAEPEPEGWVPDKDNYVNWRWSSAMAGRSISSGMTGAAC